MVKYERIELPDTPVPQRVLDAIAADGALPVCATCGTQYPADRADVAKDECPCCLDPRQYVPGQGQQWTTLNQLAQDSTHTLLWDAEQRMSLITVKPGFAIDQTPILIQTKDGSYIWDCAAPFTPRLGAYLATLERPLKAIAISHPHFFSTSLVWARALGVPLYINADDKEWFQRASDIMQDDQVVFWTGEAELGPAVKVIQCGGHFPGSSVLHWDRSGEDGPGEKTGLLLTADTIMVQTWQKGMTFMWSYPNMVPLPPRDVLSIRKRIEPLAYGAVSSTWPHRIIRRDAKDVFEKSVQTYLSQTGWKMGGDGLVPL